jgi:hypothetical protein
MKSRLGDPRNLLGQTLTKPGVSIPQMVEKMVSQKNTEVIDEQRAFVIHFITMD